MKGARGKPAMSHFLTFEKTEKQSLKTSAMYLVQYIEFYAY